jgi:hypothetical protein
MSPIAAWWAYDVWRDRHTVVIRQSTALFAGDGDAGCDGSQMGVIVPRATMKVRRIRYWKNCATVDVKLSDGRKGYIVSGGEFTVNPEWP